MKSIVITGSTRGIGLGLAKAFLAQGCAVTISGRTQVAAEQALDVLCQDADPARVLAVACNVQSPEQLQNLWEQANSRFKKVDIWINNAGYSGPHTKIWELAPDQVEDIVHTNLLGVVYGSQVAARNMLAQGYGAIYNMEGMGADGRKHAGLTFYGMTKYGMQYFNDSLALETKDTPLIIGGLRPGMVITELITGQYKDRPEELEKVKKIFNIIANRVEDVSPWLVERILANTRSGVTINYSSTWKMLWRFITAPFSKRDLFSDPVGK
jgi:NAD(P)-dependent dehydrogenase (short-subunit alcohol dehydrogenase family)